MEVCTVLSAILISSDAGHRHLRSAFTCRLIVPRAKTSYGDHSFSVHGPSVWNGLPNDLRLSDMSLETFRSRLKAFLFGHRSFDSPFAAVRNLGLINSIIIFLTLDIKDPEGFGKN